MGELAKDEIDAFLIKLRGEYRTLTKENPGIFSTAQFEERYLQVLRSRGSLETFFRDEIIFLEKLKMKNNEIKARREAMSGKSTLDKIVEENENKISHYPKIDFHPMVKAELKYFYGAIASFVESELQLLYQIFKGTAEINRLQDAIVQLERIGQKRGNQLPLRLNDHIRVISTMGVTQTKIEQDIQAIMRDGCLGLKTIAEQLDDAFKNKRINMKLAFRFHEKETPELFQKYNGKGFDEGAELIKTSCHQIINDFRMDAIVGMKK